MESGGDDRGDEGEGGENEPTGHGKEKKHGGGHFDESISGIDRDSSGRMEL